MKEKGTRENEGLSSSVESNQLLDWLAWLEEKEKEQESKGVMRGC